MSLFGDFKMTSDQTVELILDTFVKIKEKNPAIVKNVYGIFKVDFIVRSLKEMLYEGSHDF